LKSYCKGLLLPGERKSIEPMAARLDPENIQSMRQSLHHLVAKAPWSDEVLLEQVRNYVLPTLQKQGSVVAWIVDDTGFPKKGKHSVGVTRQYCGQVGKQDNCRVAVSLSVATWSSSLPVAYRLYLPKDWAEDAERREKAEVPQEVVFQTKPEIALDQIRAAVAANLDRGVVLADAAYGINTEFRDGLTALGLQYAVGVQSSMTVWEPGKQPLPAKPRGKMGRPPRLLQRSTDHQPVSVKQLAMNLPSTALREVTWREGTDRKLQSRFAAVRVRAAHRDYEKAEPHAEEWLLMEWPRGEKEPIKYWISTLPADTKLKALAKMAKHRWIIERDYEELKVSVS
jgi:SRSO17 transposase